MQTWVEINRSALRHNLREIQKLVGPQVKILANVKANAYGCGSTECAHVFADAGAAMLCVTRLEEAIPLREAGIETPILLLAPLLSDELETAISHDLTLTIASFEEAQNLSALAVAIGTVVRVHVKVNTGMNRFGAHPSKTAEVVGRGAKLPNLEVEGVYSHLANALESGDAATQTPFETFKDATFGLKDRLPNLKLHLANSAALVRFPAMRFDAVRPGTLLYGQFPGASAQTNELKLQDPFAVKARVVALQNVPKGEFVGYGSEWQAPRDSRIAILACGWADGLTMEPHARTQSPLEAVKDGLKRAARLQKNPNANREITICGQKAPLVGRVAMQTSAIDVTHLEEVQLGDEAQIPMRRLSANPLLKRVYVD